MKSKLLAAIALVLVPTFTFVEAAGAAGATAGAGTGASGAGGAAGAGTGTAGTASGTAGTATGPGAATGATGTATGTAGTATGTTGNGAGNSPQITSSMLPEVPSVTYSGELIVGETLPGTITYYPVPNYDAYDYTVLNNERVLVDANTHRIVRVFP